MLTIPRSLIRGKEASNVCAPRGIGGHEVLKIARFEVGGVESRGHRGAEECEAMWTRLQTGSLPHAAGNDHLRPGATV